MHSEKSECIFCFAGKVVEHYKKICYNALAKQVNMGKQVRVFLFR